MIETTAHSIGRSMGGDTALALVGGRPWSRSGQPIPTQVDPRVRAAVLLAPSTDWFLAPSSLTDVSVPLLVIAGERERDPARGDTAGPGGPPAGSAGDIGCGAGRGPLREGFHVELPRRIQDFLTRALAPR
jgi:hypothetical protein